MSAGGPQKLAKDKVPFIGRQSLAQSCSLDGDDADAVGADGHDRAGGR